MTSVQLVVVRMLSAASTCGVLHCGPLRLPCSLGRSGRLAVKREGDGATPAGRYRLLRVLYRADRVPRPRTALPLRPIRPHEGWCDASADRNYNRPVRLPYPASAETLWRDDHLYDVVVVLSHNQRPRIAGAGSAIFLHVAGQGFPPTAGCIALSRPHLLRLLARVGRGARIRIGSGPIPG